jgi:dihydroflavonol-4-reductase
VGVFGPVLGPDLSNSIVLVRQLLDGNMPGCPRLYFGVVDVRDLVDLHLRAMTNPDARGERFLAVAGDTLSMLDVAKILTAHFGPLAARVPRRQLPDWLVRLAAWRNPALRQIVLQLGEIRSSTSEKARRLLGWAPRSNQAAIIATAESLARLGLLKNAPPLDPRPQPLPVS